MSPLRLITCGLVVIVASSPCWAGPCPKSQECAADAEWRGHLNSLLHQFFACEKAIDDESPCNYFVAQALEAIYGNEDFQRTDGSPHPYWTANEIADLVASEPAIWMSLGEATKQEVLTEAQECANAGRPVVAVRKKEGGGHVALVIPGSVEQVGGWKLKAPCSASFFIGKPEKAFVGCPLSYAFTGEAKGIEIYCRL